MKRQNLQRFLNQKFLNNLKAGERSPAFFEKFYKFAKNFKESLLTFIIYIYKIPKIQKMPLDRGF